LSSNFKIPQANIRKYIFLERTVYTFSVLVELLKRDHNYIRLYKLFEIVGLKHEKFKLKRLKNVKVPSKRVHTKNKLY
jgi:hypothetical protein